MEISGFVRSELDILLWIQNNVRCGALNWLKYITHFADAGIGFIILALIFLAFKKTRRKGLYVTGALLVGVILVNVLIKPIAARTRPYLLEPAIQLLVKGEKDFSFPSGHTNAAFAFSWALLRYEKRGHKLWGTLAVIFSLLIGLSRLYVGVHYPTDVLAGIVTGIVAAEIARVLVKLLLKKVPKNSAVGRFLKPSSGRKRTVKR